jgi:phosphatidylglycerol lysyltransferase
VSALPGAADGAHLGLRLWTSPSEAGRLFYQDVKGYRVAAGEPQAAPGRLPDLFREFEADCRTARRRPLYFGLTAPALAALDPARGRWHAGDLPVFSLDRWRDTATIPPNIRSQARRARNQGVTVRRVAPEGGPLPASLRACLDSWILDKPLPPLDFVTTPYLFDPWPAQGVFLAERDEKCVGFLVGSRALFSGLWRVDVVGRSAGAPNGCAELLVSEAFLHAAEQGHARATLGMAPLARRSGSTAPSSSHWMDRVAEIVREVKFPGYSFAGLEAFKAKFKPDEWRPLYCVSVGGRLSLRDMLAVARVFAGGSLSGYALRSLRWRLGRRLPVGAYPSQPNTRPKTRNRVTL